jgi:hypothetical protein
MVIPMLDADTFLTQLYVMADDFVKALDQPSSVHSGARHSGARHTSALSAAASTGPLPSLYPSELLTLALLGQFWRFRSESDFWRFAQRQLRRAFPGLPERSQFNRLLRRSHELVVAFFQHLADRLRDGTLYEVLDTAALPVRNAKRAGAGHLAGQADIGLSKRLGWYEGFHLLISVTPGGAVTGYGFSEASVKEQRLCETFLSLRAHPEEARSAGLSCVGRAVSRYYIGDKGFEGATWRARWRGCCRAEVIVPPKDSSVNRRWSRALRRQMASLRQIVETTIGALESYFGLQRDRPHQLSGLRVRLAAKMALHNFCIWLNRQLGRPDLAFADLIRW